MGRSGGINKSKVSTISTRQASRLALKKEKLEEEALDINYQINKELDRAKSFFSRKNKQAAAKMIAKHTGKTEEEVLEEIERVHQNYIKELVSDESDNYDSNIKNTILNGGYSALNEIYADGYAEQVAGQYIDLSEQAYAKEIVEDTDIFEEELMYLEGQYSEEEALLIARNNAVERIVIDDRFDEWKEEKINDFYFNLDERDDFQAIVEKHFTGEFDPSEISDDEFEFRPFSEYFNQHSNIIFSVDNYLKDKK